MTPVESISIATLLSATGVWLLLPPRGTWSRAFGAVVAATGLGLFGAQLPAIGSMSFQTVFWILTTVTAISAVATISSHHPVYSALWFAMSLLGTASLLMFQGAQFLGIATIIVYAGAIVVTFLFVLMLAQPDGTAFYDRIGWGTGASLLSAVCGALIVGVTTYAMVQTNFDPGETEQTLAAGLLHNQHVATLGGQLFTKHLVAIEVAGVLLLVALVGATTIATHGRRKATPPDETARGPEQ